MTKSRQFAKTFIVHGINMIAARCCGVMSRVGYRLNFIDFDSDSAYRFRFFSIPSFDSNVMR